MFAQQLKLSRHDIANYERGWYDIPAKVLAEQDQQGFCVGWVLSGRGKCCSEIAIQFWVGVQFSPSQATFFDIPPDLGDIQNIRLVAYYYRSEEPSEFR